MTNLLYNCPVCKNDFYAKRKEQITCSVTCKQSYVASSVDWSSMPTQKECKKCGGSFSRNPKHSAKQWDEKLYCSVKCAKSHQAETGWTHSEETRLRLSLAHKGTKKPWAGRYARTEKHRIAAALAAANMSEETKKRRSRAISLASTGRKHTERSIERIRESWQLRPAYKGGKDTLKERKAFYQRRREAKKRASGFHTLCQWELVKNSYDNTCPCCLVAEPDIKLTQDHVVPITKGGTDEISNIQPLCQICNSKKMTTPIRYLPRSYPFGSGHPLGAKFGVSIEWPCRETQMRKSA